MTEHRDLAALHWHGTRFTGAAGSPVGVVTPAQVGQGYQDTTTSQIWFATGLTDTDWATIPTGLHAADHLPGGSDEIVGLTTYRVSVGRNSANTTDLWLRDANGIPTNLSPVRVPYTSRLILVAATGNAAETWDAEVYSGGVPRAGGVPVDGTKDTEIAVAAANSAQITVAVNYAIGDEIGVFMRGANINRPRVDLYFIRTA